jgi:L-amino acid N-acyltransferase YncA
MTVDIRLLGPGDAGVLEHVAPGVFDNPVDPGLAQEFLRDARHHLVVAIDAGQVVGFASGVHYLHPDKAAELWVNEVGVASTHGRQGLGRTLLRRLFEHARSLGCRQAWVLTHRGNAAAMGLYGSVGGRETPAVVMFDFELSPRES